MYFQYDFCAQLLRQSHLVHKIAQAKMTRQLLVELCSSHNNFPSPILFKIPDRELGAGAAAGDAGQRLYRPAGDLPGGWGPPQGRHLYGNHREEGEIKDGSPAN